MGAAAVKNMLGFTFRDLTFLAQGLDIVTVQYIARVNALRATYSTLAVLDNTTIQAIDTFVKGCRKDLIWDKMIEVNAVLRVSGATDNIHLAAAPLLIGPQGAPDHSSAWTIAGFVEANLTANGLVGVPSSSTRMHSNIQPSSTFKGVNNVGISMYVSGITSTANSIDIGAFSADNANCLLLYANSFSSHSAAGCWNSGGGDGPSATAPNLAGFYTFSRTASNNVKLYFANSGNAFAQIGTNNTSTGTWFNTNNSMALWCCLSNAGTPFDFTDRRLSFIAFHDGLTLSESQSLYNRVQQLRTDLGGGFA